MVRRRQLDLSTVKSPLEKVVDELQASLVPEGVTVKELHRLASFLRYDNSPHEESLLVRAGQMLLDGLLPLMLVCSGRELSAIRGVFRGYLDRCANDEIPMDMFVQTLAPFVWDTTKMEVELAGYVAEAVGNDRQASASLLGAVWRLAANLPVNDPPALLPGGLGLSTDIIRGQVQAGVEKKLFQNRNLPLPIVARWVLDREMLLQYRFQHLRRVPAEFPDLAGLPTDLIWELLAEQPVPEVWFQHHFPFEATCAMQEPFPVVG